MYLIKLNKLKVKRVHVIKMNLTASVV